MTAIRTLGTSVLLLGVWGCAADPASPPDRAEQQAPLPEIEPSVAQVKSDNSNPPPLNVRHSNEPAKLQTEQRKKPPPPTEVYEVVAAGSPVKVRLAHRVSSRTNVSGERFEAILNEDIRVEGEILARAGSTVIGRLTRVKESGNLRGQAQVAMTLTELTLRGESQNIRTNELSFEGGDGQKKEVTFDPEQLLHFRLARDLRIRER